MLSSANTDDRSRAPRCSIVIPVYNRAGLTRHCLNHLLARLSDDDRAEVIVVDDKSTEESTRALLAAYGDLIRPILRPTNGGFAHACNEGAAAARGEYVIFLNNDTLPRTGWLRALRRYADRHPSAAMVGSKLLYPDGTVQHAGTVIGQDRRPRHLYAGFPGDHPAVNKSRRYQAVTAACALVRRAAFEQVGGFDTAFRNGYEDVDLCLRLGERDHEVHYCHQSVVYHLESASRGFRPAALAHNDRLYHSRWAHRVRPDDVRYYREDGLLYTRYPDRDGVSPPYPIRLDAAPVLAVFDGEGAHRRADQLLEKRSREIVDRRLRIVGADARAREADGAENVEHDPAVEAGVTRARGSIIPYRVEAEGRVHALASSDPRGRLVSVVMPVKNGAPYLAELLPKILAQRTPDRVELIAVDSGSSDDSVELLRRHGATVLSIDPTDFNHGLTRNLLASYARGRVVVFVNQSTLPADDVWLANLVRPLASDPDIAGVCSRTLPRRGADPLTSRDILSDPNAARARNIREINNWAAYRSLAPHQRRLLVNFHTMSAAIRPRVLARIPFRSVTIGEDVFWAKDVLEAGFRVLHEPTSVVYHSHAYSPAELFQRNVDDGIANRALVGRRLAVEEIVPMLATLVRMDSLALARDRGLEGDQAELLRLASVVRRAVQTVGQWAGTNHDQLAADVLGSLSLTSRIKAGAILDEAGIAPDDAGDGS